MKKTLSEKPKAPAHLTETTRQWFDWIIAEFQIETHDIRTLVIAAEAWDLKEKCREAIATGGPTYIDRFGQPKERPEVQMMMNAGTLFLKCLRELALNVSAPNEEYSRPPNIPPRASLRAAGG